MPANTPNLVLPYPLETDTPDVPRDVQALATKLDSLTLGAGMTSTSVAGANNDIPWKVGNASICTDQIHAAAAGATLRSYGLPPNIATTVGGSILILDFTYCANPVTILNYVSGGAGQVFQTMDGNNAVITGGRIVFVYDTTEWNELYRVQDGGWHVIGAAGQPAFQNSWANLGLPASQPQARYRKTSSGMVVLSGVITGGTVGQPAFVLPAGYRPYYGSGTSGTQAWFTVASNSSTALGSIEVRNDGSIIPNVGSAWWFLDNIQFFAEA